MQGLRGAEWRLLSSRFLHASPCGDFGLDWWPVGLCEAGSSGGLLRVSSDRKGVYSWWSVSGGFLGSKGGEAICKGYIFGMKINTYLIALSVVLVFACCGLGWWCHELRRQVGVATGELATAGGERDRLAHDLAQLQDEIVERVSKATALADGLAAAEAEVKRLQSEKSEAERGQEKLEREMHAALAEQEVTISRLKGKLTVNILDRIMFDSGRADLKPEGQQLLLKLAEVLKTVPDRQVLVVGHTDNVPVTASRHLFASNWELSALRATSALRYLCERGGVEAARLGALGHGEYHPIADLAPHFSCRKEY